MAEPRRDWVWAAVALGALLVLVVLLIPPESQLAGDRRLSTLRTTPDGAGALYAALVELGVPVERRMTPLAGADPIRGPLALLAPTEPPTPAEVDSLLSWVAAGGRLILAPGMTGPLSERLGLESAFADVDPDDRALTPLPHRWTRDLPPIGPYDWGLVPLPDSAPAYEPLLVLPETREDGRPVLAAALLTVGRGRILVLSQPWMLSNDRVDDSALATIVARAAAEWTQPGRPLTFDEFHHGHRGGSAGAALADFLTGHPAGRAMIQLALVAVLALVPAAVRLGSPVEPRPPVRRSPLEHVAALGEMYRQAGAEELARRRLMSGFARRLGRDRPVPGEEPAFLERLERGSASGAEAVAAVRGAWSGGAGIGEFAARIDEAVHRLNRKT